MIRSKLQQLMYGRNGADQLALATMWGGLILWILNGLLHWFIFYIGSLALMGYTLFRIFSRRIDKRRAENARFLNRVRPLQHKASAWRTRAQDKEHRYFRCPNCKQQMRVPRGKGRIQVTCRRCGITFEIKS